MIYELSIYDFNLGHLQSTKSLSNVNHEVLRMLEIRMAPLCLIIPCSLLTELQLKEVSWGAM